MEGSGGGSCPMVQNMIVVIMPKAQYLLSNGIVFFKVKLFF